MTTYQSRLPRQRRIPRDIKTLAWMMMAYGVALLVLMVAFQDARIDELQEQLTEVSQNG